MNAELDECMESAERVLLECYEKAGTIIGNLPESNRGLRLQAAAMLAECYYSELQSMDVNAIRGELWDIRQELKK